MACRYVVEPQLVDVGPVLFDRASDREVSIHNKGRVQFQYEVDTGALSCPSVCDVSPKTGIVLPGQHAVLKLKVCSPWSLLHAISCYHHNRLSCYPTDGSCRLYMCQSHCQMLVLYQQIQRIMQDLHSSLC